MADDKNKSNNPNQNKNMNTEDKDMTTGFDPSQSRVGGEAGITDPNQNKDMNVGRTGGQSSDQSISGREKKQDWEKNKRE